MHKRLFLLNTTYKPKQTIEFEHVDKVILQEVKEEEKEKKKRLDAELWHWRFGHVSYRTIGSMEGAVSRMSLEEEKRKGVANPECEDCVKGTISRKPFHPPRHPATQILERIHTDVCGPMEAMSLGRKRYFVLFTDEYTRYSTGYFMERKSEVFRCFQEFHASVERSTGKKIKALRSDGGGEYQGKQFQDYLRRFGIQSQCTVPYTPQENGIAERQNRTLLNKVLSMMSAVNALKSFWVLAYQTAIYLRNRSPSKSLNGKTPFEMWFGDVPSVSHLRVWGCKVLYQIPKAKRRKLDYKAKKGIFVGYEATSKHYKVYDSSSS